MRSLNIFFKFKQKSRIPNDRRRCCFIKEETKSIIQFKRKKNCKEDQSHFQLTFIACYVFQLLIIYSSVK